MVFESEFNEFNFGILILKQLTIVKDFHLVTLPLYNRERPQLTALVEAFPYTVPKIIPPLVHELENHLNGPQIVSESAKKTLQNFKSSHQFSYSEDKMNSSTLFHVPPDYIL